MSGPFIGYSENAVHNNRVIIPAAFKRKLAEEANRTVVITVGPLNSIALYPLDSWVATLDALAQGDENHRRFRTRLIDCAVMEAELEGPGRVRIPEKQLAEAGIKDSVVVKGEMHYISLWNPQDYYKQRSQNMEANLKEYDTNMYQVTGK
jgi:division/cell wall cluster transcriptional repressor MraZ